MEEEAGTAILAGLADPDLVGLRLAAQVLAHKAELEDRPRVAGYFAQLEQDVQTELASRVTGIRAVVSGSATRADAPADASDRRLVNEYLGLLVANDKLPQSVRDACRLLRSRNLA